jgi:hypothetical protein
MFLAAFAAVALPLLWRNVTVFGNPFWNVNSAKVFWLDEWAQFFDPAAMERAGPLHYLATHPPMHVVARLATGMVKQSIHLLEDLSPLAVTAALGAPALVLVACCTLADPGRARRSLVVLLFAIFFLSFAWYSQVVTDHRFLAAIVPVLLVPVAGLWPRLPDAGRLPALRFGVSVLATGMIVAALLRGALGFDPDRFEPAPWSGQVHAFLREHVGRNDRIHYLLGPSDRTTFDWDREIRGTRHGFPRTQPELDELLAGPEGFMVRYALVEDRPPSGRSDDTWIARLPNGGIEGRPPPSWSLVRKIPEGAPSVLVFERR